MPWACTFWAGTRMSKNKDDLVAALNSSEPNGAVWERQRLEYYVKKIRGKMLEEQRRPK